MKVSYQNYRQQKQSSKVMRSYIVQAAAKGATEEELDILCQAYLLEQKYRLSVNPTVTESRPAICRIHEIAVFDTRSDAEKVYSQMLEMVDQYGMITVNDYYELCGLGDKTAYEFNYYGWSKDTVSNMSIVRIGSNYMIDVPRAVHFFQMKGENHA